MSHVAFQGTGEVVVTFHANDNTPALSPIVLADNATVAAAATDDAPVGVALHCREGFASVLLHGFVELPYSGTAPDLTWVSLVADGNGGVKLASTGQAGTPALVVFVDPTGNRIGCYL